MYPNCEFVLREPCEKCEIKFVTSSTLNSHPVTGNKVVLNYGGFKQKRICSLRLKKPTNVFNGVLSLPPSSRYLIRSTVP